jgi:hypothetical protein
MGTGEVLGDEEHVPPQSRYCAPSGSWTLSSLQFASKLMPGGKVGCIATGSVPSGLNMALIVNSWGWLRR